MVVLLACCGLDPVVGGALAKEEENSCGLVAAGCWVLAKVLDSGSASSSDDACDSAWLAWEANSAAEADWCTGCRGGGGICSSCLGPLEGFPGD